mmetsp:Transcript_11639/g.31203  ORF Transcript_11639/g.31203 Transcript_11639/m.31203 type:complete len:234 (-) Transcript_11639:415-1116(-)
MMSPAKKTWPTRSSNLRCIHLTMRHHPTAKNEPWSFPKMTCVILWSKRITRAIDAGTSTRNQNMTYDTNCAWLRPPESPHKTKTPRVHRTDCGNCPSLLFSGTLESEPGAEIFCSSNSPGPKRFDWLVCPSSMGPGSRECPVTRKAASRKISRNRPEVRPAWLEGIPQDIRQDPASFPLYVMMFSIVPGRGWPSTLFATSSFKTIKTNTHTITASSLVPRMIKRRVKARSTTA